MKTLSISFLALLMSCVFSSKALSSDNPTYAKAMEETLAQLDTATTVQSLQKCKNAFERIIPISAEEWMPLYYVAYCDIRSAFANPRSDKAVLFLGNSKQSIEKLRENKAANRSEVETLSGLYNMAMITLDPQTNGQAYFGEVIGALRKAQAMNPENPRPRALLVFFNAQLPDFIKEKMNEQEEIETATALFAKEEKSIDQPYWGEEYLRMIRK